jgi:hypothetical protein
MEATTMATRAAHWMMAAGLLLAAAEARAQETGPPIAVEGTIGWSGFVDDATVQHAVYGGALRVGVTPRISVGPEVMYMVGPRTDRDVVALGTLWFDLLTPRRDLDVQPYLVAGGGFMHHSEGYFGRRVGGSDGTFSLGGGVRVRVNDRVYAGVDARIGWEPNLRIAGHVGVRLR